MPLFQKLTQTVPSDAKFLFIPRPVDDKCFAIDCLQVDKSPEAAVKAFIPIVSHHKEFMFRHFDRSEIVARPDIAGIVGCRAAVDEKRASNNRHFGLQIVDAAIK